MAINLTSLVQKNLGYPALLKMDAKTREVVIAADLPAEVRFSQAAIPAVLFSFYKFTRANETAEMLLYNGKIGDWMTVIHNGNTEKVIKVVADYSSQPIDGAWEKMNVIAGEAVRLLKKAIGTRGTAVDVKTLMARQRNYILPYLPAEIQLAAMLIESTLEDRINKIKGRYLA
jgi:hypothetical protein